MTKSSQPFGLYLHLPYCIKKCPYCDFNSYAVGSSLNGELETQYLSALLLELEYYLQLPYWQGRRIRSVFFGGGTPSLFSPQSISSILTRLSANQLVSSETEITLEANPGTIQERLGAEKLKGFLQVGVNRISIGAQSFNEDKLRTLGRLHSGDDIKTAVQNVIMAGFSNFSLDLIFGVKGETESIWQSDLCTAFALGPSHLSAYGLTIEPGTEFFRLQRSGTSMLASEDLQAELFGITQSMCNAKGFTQYEISNYAQLGLECIHNLGYWRGIDYLGLGAGAHSFQRAPVAKRWSNTPGPVQYIERVKNSGSAVQREEKLSEEKEKIEFFFLGLRLKEGISLDDYATKFKAKIPQSAIDSINNLKQKDLITFDDNRVALSTQGWLFADGVMSEITSYL